MELLAQLPPSEVENHAVWHHILLRALSQDTRRRVETEMISLTQKVLADHQPQQVGEVLLHPQSLLWDGFVSITRRHSDREDGILLSDI